MSVFCSLCMGKIHWWQRKSFQYHKKCWLTSLEGMSLPEKVQRYFEETYKTNPGLYQNLFEEDVK